MKAVTLTKIGKIPADTVVTVIHKGNQCIVHHKQQAEHADQRFDFVIIPEVWEIKSKLHEVGARYNVNWSSSTSLYTVTGFEFGLASRVSVPVFANGKVTGQKFVTTTRHVSISADNEETLFRKLFRACVSGRLYKHFSPSRLDRLYWDVEFDKFSTQVVDKASIEV